jgi:hypothetical protein
MSQGDASKVIEVAYTKDRPEGTGPRHKARSMARGKIYRNFD